MASVSGGYRAKAGETKREEKCNAKAQSRGEEDAEDSVVACRGMASGEMTHRRERGERGEEDENGRLLACRGMGILPMIPTGETPSRLLARRQRYIHCRTELACAQKRAGTEKSHRERPCLRPLRAQKARRIRAQPTAAEEIAEPPLTPKKRQNSSIFQYSLDEKGYWNGSPFGGPRWVCSVLPFLRVL